MQVRIRQSGQVMFENEFRALHPNTSMPQILSEELLNEFGADVVFEGQQASPTRYQVAFADGVEQVNGKWYTKYSVSDMDADAITAKDTEQAKAVRATRDSKLAESDWRVIKAAETSTSLNSAWATYRQALRDITSQSGFPWTITWPESP